MLWLGEENCCKQKKALFVSDCALFKEISHVLNACQGDIAIPYQMLGYFPSECVLFFITLKLQISLHDRLSFPWVLGLQSLAVNASCSLLP